MNNKTKEAILKLIKQDKKIHASTELKLKRQKNSTVIYEQLNILYDKDIKGREFAGKSKLKEFGLLDREHLIEYIRFKNIADKIDIIGRNNAISIGEVVNYITEIKDQEISNHINKKIDEYIDRLAKEGEDGISEVSSKELSEYKGQLRTELLKNKLKLYTEAGIRGNIYYIMKSINISNRIVSKSINKFVKSIDKEGEISNFIEGIIIKYNMSENLSKEEGKALVRGYLNSKRLDIPMHNIDHFTTLYKLQNLEKNKDLNTTFKHLKSLNPSLDNVNFIHEEKLKEYLYDEIEARPSRLKNMEYYMLENRMELELKKVILKTANDIIKKDEKADLKEEILKISIMQRVDDIFIYDQLGRLYVDLYPNYKEYLKCINTLKYIEGKWLRLLKNWEIEGFISDKDILKEIELFPLLCMSKNYRNDYRYRKGFNKSQYESYNSLRKIDEYKMYKERLGYYKEGIYEEIIDLLLLEWNKRLKI